MYIYCFVVRRQYYGEITSIQHFGSGVGTSGRKCPTCSYSELHSGSAKSYRSSDEANFLNFIVHR